MSILEGKRALVMGVATKQSLAYGIAQAFRREGAELALSYQNERMGREVARLAAGLGCELQLECDVQSDAQIDRMVESLAERWDGLDVLVHAIAHAPREALHGDYLDGLTREAWRHTQDVSAYSLSALARAARPLLARRGGCLLTLSYLGGERTIANYNVMGPAKASLEASVRYLAVALGPDGIRVNAISAGPIRTLAAGGIGGLRRLLEHAVSNAPLRRSATIDDVGNAAAFLCSDLAAGITGEITHVDCGLNIVGLAPEAGAHVQ